MRNGEEFLAEAIDSMLRQTGVDLEVVVVDDGSTDGTAQIVRGYASAHPGRVRMIAHPGGANLGIAASRNAGLAVARGRFVAFLDADDVWEPEKTAEQLAIFRSHPDVGLVYGRTLIWHGWSPDGQEPDHYVPLGVEPGCAYAPPDLFSLLTENQYQSPTVCNAIMRREVFDRLGGFDPAFRGMFEDATFFARALATTPVYVSDRSWAKYRQHPLSWSARSAALGQDESARLRFLLWLRRSICTLSTDPCVTSAVNRALVSAAVRAVRGPLGRLRRRVMGDWPGLLGSRSHPGRR